MNLFKYIVRRLIIIIPILFSVITLTFFLSRFMPGNPLLTPELYDRASPEYIRNILEFYGFEKSLLEQYIIYLKNMFRGDWGISYSFAIEIPVWQLIRAKFPVTLEISLYSFILSSFIGVKAGVFSATHRKKTGDIIVRTLAIIGVAIPVFVLAIILQYFLAIKLNWFPTINRKTPGFSDPEQITSFRLIDCLITGNFGLFLDTAWHYILPIISLTLIQIADITRISRSSMLEVLESDYIRSARAKGCKEKDVINKHALRNALIPTVTIIGLRFGNLLGGQIFVECTFNIRGLGYLLVDAVFRKDYFVINGLVFILSIVFCVAVLMVDILYAVIDPRIKF